MSVLLIIVLLGLCHCLRGQTQMSSGLVSFCQDQNLTIEYINPLHDNTANFFCETVGPLNPVRVSWYHEESFNDALQRITPNEMFQTGSAVLKFINLTIGRVQGQLRITHLNVMNEGIYSCVFEDMDLSSRQFSGCLLAVGLGAFEACPESRSGCSGITQQFIMPGERAVFDVRVIFRDGGGHVNEQISQLTLRKDSKVVYMCTNADSRCSNAKYSRFSVIQGTNCTNCKFYISLVLLGVGEQDVGTYVVEVIFEDTFTQSRNITKEFEIKLIASSGGETDRGVLIGVIVALTVLLLFMVLTVVIVAVALLNRRREPIVVASPGIVSNGNILNMDEANHEHFSGEPNGKCEDGVDEKISEKIEKNSAVYEDSQS